MTRPQPFRIAPAMAVGAYKTYELRSPHASHYRRATCKEVECKAYERGWKTVVDVSTTLGEEQASYIGKFSGRRFVLEVTEGLHTYTFPAGQKCFDVHQVPLERDPILVVRDGDYRGNPTGKSRTHTRVADWLEDFAEHQQGLSDEIERGAL